MYTGVSLPTKKMNSILPLIVAGICDFNEKEKQQ